MDAEEDEDVVFVFDRLVGSDVEEGRVAVPFSVGRLADNRIEGRRRRVGGAVDDPGSDIEPLLSFGRPNFSLSFLALGLGGGVRCSLRAGTPAGVPLSSSSSSPSSKSNIFAKFSPTLGELLNNLANSAGVGVARVSPVAVRTTPFMADGM